VVPLRVRFILAVLFCAHAAGAARAADVDDVFARDGGVVVDAGPADAAPVVDAGPDAPADPSDFDPYAPAPTPPKIVAPRAVGATPEEDIDVPAVPARPPAQGGIAFEQDGPDAPRPVMPTLVTDTADAALDFVTRSTTAKVAGAAGAAGGFVVAAGAGAGLLWLITMQGASAATVTLGLVGGGALLAALPAAGVLLATVPFTDFADGLASAAVVVSLAPLLGGGLAVGGGGIGLVLGSFAGFFIGGAAGQWAAVVGLGMGIFFGGALGSIAAGWTGGWAAEVPGPDDGGGE
jgi:hypothetical protein